MKRKVIQIANSTQLISLPRKWALKNGIQKGQELDVTEVNNKIVVSTDSTSTFRSIKFDISDYSPQMLRWALFLLHKQYDEVEFFYKDQSQVQQIQQIIKTGELLGFEIIEQGKKRCVVRAISQGLEKEFDSILRRIFLVTISMAEGCYEMVEQGSFEELKDILILEETNNKLTNFCERILNKNGYEDEGKTHFIYLIVWQMENIADHYKYIGNYLVDQGKDLTGLHKDIIGYFKETNSALKGMYELFYKFNKEGMLTNTDKLIQMQEKGRTLFAKGSTVDSVVLNHLLTIIQQVKDILPSVMAFNFKTEN